MPYGFDACCVRDTATILLEICVRLNRRTGVGRVPAAKISPSSCALLAAAVRSSVRNSCLVLDALVFLRADRNGVSVGAMFYYVNDSALYRYLLHISMQNRLSLHLLIQVRGARGFITAFARNLVVTPSPALGLSAYVWRLARYCLWVTIPLRFSPSSPRYPMSSMQCTMACTAKRFPV